MRRVGLVFQVFWVGMTLAVLSPVVCAQGTESSPRSATIAETVRRIEAAENRSEFRFAVLGDTRPDGALHAAQPGAQPPNFKRAVGEINLLRPAFLIDVGDLIMGYTGDPELIRREWTGFQEVVATCEVPFVPVIGNHDVWDKTSQDVWQEMYGPLHFSFDFRACHFVCLDTEEVGYSGQISDAQYEWLRQDLWRNRDAAHVFVFMHQPVFQSPEWARIHRFLRQVRTEIVFAGHIHRYEARERDGIRYIITGGGGAEIGNNPVAGDFHHYCLVRVPEEGPVAHAVVRTGHIEPWDVVRAPSP